MKKTLQIPRNIEISELTDFEGWAPYYVREYTLGSVIDGAIQLIENKKLRDLRLTCEGGLQLSFKVKG